MIHKCDGQPGASLVQVMITETLHLLQAKWFECWLVKFGHMQCNDIQRFFKGPWRGGGQAPNKYGQVLHKCQVRGSAYEHEFPWEALLFLWPWMNCLSVQYLVNSIPVIRWACSDSRKSPVWKKSQFVLVVSELTFVSVDPPILPHSWIKF